MFLFLRHLNSMPCISVSIQFALTAVSLAMLNILIDFQRSFLKENVGL
jgi:hypothetical protein